MIEKMMCHIADQLFDGIYYVSRDMGIEDWNKGAERITGYSRDEVVGKKCSDNILRHLDENGKELCLEGCPLSDTLIDGAERTADVFLHHKDGHRVPVSIRVIPVKNDAGEIEGALEIFMDRTSRSNVLREIEKLRKEVFVDGLTGVANRKFARLKLQSHLQDFKIWGISLGVLFVDVDHFKYFNDQYGHNTGDSVLKMISRTISNMLRKIDTISRWGGEEFVVLIPDISRENLEKTAHRIRTFIEKSWLAVNGSLPRTTVSIGGTMARKGDTPDAIIERADRMMYECKKAGRNCSKIEAPHR